MNKELTEELLSIRAIASPNRSATGNSVILGCLAFSSSNGTVSVATTRSKSAPDRRDSAGPESNACVKQATGSYRAEMDWISTFLSDRCVLLEGKTESAKSLYGAFCTWWSGDDETPTQKEFGSRLRAKGLKNKKKSGNYLWHGIALTSKDQQDD